MFDNSSLKIIRGAPLNNVMRKLRRNSCVNCNSRLRVIKA